MNSTLSKALRTAEWLLKAVIKFACTGCILKLGACCPFLALLDEIKEADSPQMVLVTEHRAIGLYRKKQREGCPL